MTHTAHHVSALPGMVILGGSTLLGYYAGALARRIRLPALIGYMLLGVLLGPSLFEIFTEGAEGNLEQFSFLTELALGFVAFSIGAELDLKELRRLGSGVVAIIFAESFGAFFVVLAAVYALTRDLPLSLIFASMAPASAPAGTVAVIQETRSKGPLTKALYAVVGFDDGLAIMIFGFAAALARTLLQREMGVESEGMLRAMRTPLIEILGSLAVGAVLGVAFCLMVRRLQQSRDILIVLAGTVLLASGLAQWLHLSLILTNLMIGFLLVNTRTEALVHRVTAPLADLMPLLFVLFFCLAGAHLNVSMLGSLGLLGLVYILARSAGLIGGSRVGALLGHVEPTIKNWIGLGILSQAGVAIGLSLIVKQDFDALGSEHATMIGATVITSITATCIVFEIIGPILTKVALTKAGETGKA